MNQENTSVEPKTEKQPEISRDAVFVASEAMPAGSVKCKGYDFDKGPVDYDDLFKAMLTTGFQATKFGEAIQEVNRMLKWRLSDDPTPKNDDGTVDRSKVKCKIFFGFTSNMISCGVRESIRFLAKHKMVDYIVTTCGAIEEDIMKCKNPHYMGSFDLKGKTLRKAGLNRIGNLIVPNKNYCDFEDFLNPILDAMLKAQEEEKYIWSPSKIIDRLGKEINHEDSFLYWCHMNKIPVFCPAITDGSVGDMIYFHSFRNPGLIVDLVQDIRLINDAAMWAEKTAMLILGGGVVKHHICNANLMRNGADFSVFINTGHAYDGSDAGASPDEAISWGKIKIDAKPVKVTGDASLLFPLLVAQTFAKEVTRRKEEQKK